MSLVRLLKRYGAGFTSVAPSDQIQCDLSLATATPTGGTLGKIADILAQVAQPGPKGDTGQAGPSSDGNLITNGNFTINERGYVSGAALPANGFAHDRWRGSASGSGYGFTQGSPDTAIAITAGTLIQAIEAALVRDTSFWLVWPGTAAARVYQGSSPGYYSAGTAVTIGGKSFNALFVSGVTPGAVLYVEFTNGTIAVGGVRLSPAASTAVPPAAFVARPNELALCRRYFQRWQQPPLRGLFGGGVAQRLGMPIPRMYAAPSLAMTGNLPVFNGITATTIGSIATNYSSASACEFDGNLTATTNYSDGQALVVYQTGGATYLDLTAEVA